MNDYKQILCIVAGQRAGTTALQSALASTGKFYDFGEIFQTTEARRKGAFLDYAQGRSLQIADLASIESAHAQIDAYLDSLRELSGVSRCPLIDVKLNSWNALRSFWGYAHEEPLLLNVLKKQETRFIFVARRDLTAQILSEKIARHANKWHDLSDDEIQQPITIDPRVVAYQAQLIILAEKTLFGFLKITGNVFPVWYEDLYVDGATKPSLKEWLNQNFELDLRACPIPAIQKNRVSKEANVNNFKEAAKAVTDVIEKFGRVDFVSS